MNLQPDFAFKRIIARRDRRFDGQFYFGVKTTKIYCRPVCPARPKPENVVIFKSVSDAERNGYRACLRCHPDVAPGGKFFDGTLNTVSRALRIIGDSIAPDLDIPRLAGSLGVTDRHLRRLFDEHLGASPVEIMITQRLHLAKQILQETAKPVTEIALAAGFQSIRRFNEAFKARYRQSPRDFRRARGAAAPAGLSLRIPVRLPYDWKTTLAYLKRHEAYGLERVEANFYERYWVRNNGIGFVTVTKKESDEFLSVRFTDVPLADVRFVLGRLKNLFDADHNPIHLPATKKLDPAGIRVPGCFDPFEVAVSVILSQWVSTEHAKRNLKDLIERFGTRAGTQGGRDVFEFPSPNVLASARVEKIGLTRVKAGAIRELARALRDGEIDFKAHVEFSKVKERLAAIKGVGPWTVMMIAMRCLGDADAFPELDLVIRRALEKKRLDQKAWVSSRAYLTHCIWREWGGKI